MIDSREVYDSYIRPFRLVESLGLKCGYEKSFKLMQGHLLRNRYLLGIDKSDLKLDELLLICRRLGMPEAFLEDLTGIEAGANLIFLGFEENTEDCIYKVYLEYWDRIVAKLKQAVEPYEPDIMFLGYKWSVTDSERRALTRYIYYPQLSHGQILERMRMLYSADRDTDSFSITSAIIDHYAHSIDSASCIYLEAGEDDSPRKSFDLNLYKVGIKLAAIHPLLRRLCASYAIPTGALDRLMSEIGSCPLGHLSGGMDREGRGFLTVYYEPNAN